MAKLQTFAKWFFEGKRVSKATPTAPTARFCIAQVRTRVGSTFRDVCAHARTVGVSTGSLRNSLFPHRWFFRGQPSPESDPHCPHHAVLHRTSSYSRWINFFVTFARMAELLVCQALQKLTFSPQAVFSWATESRKRPPLPPLPLTARFCIVPVRTGV